MTDDRVTTIRPRRRLGVQARWGCNSLTSLFYIETEMEEYEEK